MSFNYLINKKTVNKGNKFQKIEKHKLWLKKNRIKINDNKMFSDNISVKKNHFERYINGEKIVAKKSLGQNFLQDKNVVDCICNSVEINNKVVLEVGPGTGFLTENILNNHPNKMFLIEKDTKLYEDLKIKFNKEINDAIIDILNLDALKLDILSLSKKSNCKITIICNLPYNIGTTLVLNWLREIDKIENIVVMLQKEVVDRMIAKPNTKDYGRISVLLQTFCNVKKILDVKPESFYPKPKVMSSVVSITQKFNKLDEKLLSNLDIICKIAFSQRRKKLTNVFKNHKEIEFIPNIFLEKRAEQLSVEDYIKIAKNM